MSLQSSYMIVSGLFSLLICGPSRTQLAEASFCNLTLNADISISSGMHSPWMGIPALSVRATCVAAPFSLMLLICLRDCHLLCMLGRSASLSAKSLYDDRPPLWAFRAW